MNTATHIIATGEAIPSKTLLSTELDKQLNQPEGWLESMCGVRSRSVVSDGDTQEAMGCAAAKSALSQARVAPENLDLILFGASVGRQPIPATAALIKLGLGLNASAAPAYDINATCLSALTAMDVAHLHITGGRAKTVLVVSSEISTRALPWETDPATAGLFGDGAGAVVLQAKTDTEKGLKIQQFAMETWAEGYDFCELPAGGTRYDIHQNPASFTDNAYFKMDGGALFRLTHKILPEFIERLIGGSGWKADEVDLVIPHQASLLGLDHMVKKCSFSPDKVVNTVKETGNLVAASLPISLHSARMAGRIKPGMKVLMIGTSAGVSIAGMTLQA